MTKERRIKSNARCPVNKNIAHYPLSTRLRESDQLGVRWQPVFADAALLETLLHVYPPRLVEAYVPPLHDPEDLLLALCVQAGARIAFHIVRHVEVCGVQPGLDVLLEVGGQGCILVEGRGEAVQPGVAGNVQDWFGRLMLVWERNGC